MYQGNYRCHQLGAEFQSHRYDLTENNALMLARIKMSIKWTFKHCRNHECMFSYSRSTYMVNTQHALLWGTLHVGNTTAEH